jgi:hypothetical protein
MDPAVQPWFGAKWFSTLRTPKEVPGRHKWFDDDDDLKDAVQAATFYEEGIQKLVPRYDKCLNNGGEYVEK